MKIILSLLFLMFAAFTAASRAQNKNLTIKAAMGTAKYNGKPVQVGETITPGGMLELDDNPQTYVDLLYPEGHQLRLKKGAHLKISAESTDNLELFRGQVFAYFAKNKNAEKVRIKTATAVAGVRGTKYLIEEDEKKGTYICVCEGEVRVSSVLKPDELPVKVKAGQDVWAAPRGADWNKTGNAIPRPTNSPNMSQMTTTEFKAMGY
jgi:hypothetical protein